MFEDFGREDFQEVKNKPLSACGANGGLFYSKIKAG